MILLSSKVSSYGYSEELSIARLRLRTAEDFEIKYELLTKQNNSLLH